MTGTVPVLPEALAARLHQEGAASGCDLASLVAEFADRWQVELGYALDLPIKALVVRGRRHERPVVIKVHPSDAEARRESDVLSAADGRGYVRFLDADVERGVLLLEGLSCELEPMQPHDADWRGAQTMTTTLSSAWTLPIDTVPADAPEDHPARRLAGLIEAFDRSTMPGDCSRALDRALAYAEQRVADHDPDREVVVHGNPRPGNFRRVQEPRDGAESGYALVDPIGFRSDREYDLGVVLNEGPRGLLASDDPVVLARRWCARLAETTDADAELIWQWSFLQRVAKGCELAQGAEPMTGRAHLQAACALVGRRAG